eukprot:GHVL01028751.1.p1 GENE.GHVL01028751.1~~GHVL01028751.1.p1  ORF type:complete len:113 (+),score=15.59 GHVL01028751.1:38-340(+)
MKSTTYSKCIPSNDFDYYSKSIWKAILKHERVNIPSQIEMLSESRCETIKNAVIKETVLFIEGKQTECESSLISEFPKWSSDVMRNALLSYEKQAQHYKK